VRRKIFVPIHESSVAKCGHDGVAESRTINSGSMAERRTEDDEILTVGQVCNFKTPVANDLQASPEWRDSGMAGRKQLAVSEFGDYEALRKKRCVAANNQDSACDIAEGKWQSQSHPYGISESKTKIQNLFNYPIRPIQYRTRNC
jgi:hypothetical protein